MNAASAVPPAAAGRDRRVERHITRLIQCYQLDRIELSTHDGKRFWAVAYPSPSSRIVSERREAAFRAAPMYPSFSIDEAAAISDKAVTQELCRAGGDTIEHAIETLAGTLTVWRRDAEAG